jgi:pSer/pThr/pTyr-binding forkhead associated (FHA) protein
MRLELVATSNRDSRTLDSLPVVVGRHPEEDVELDGPVQGNYHCLITRADNHLVVWDLGSAGDTLVNGVRVTKASLKAGDTLTLGGTDFAVKYQQPSPGRYMFGPRS